MNSPVAAFQRILEVLDRLEIPYFVTGSVAGSVYGIARTTLDIDLVADVRPEHIDPLVAELRSDFYVDAEMIKNAMAHGRAFNLIHLPSSYKIDVFPLGRDEYGREAFRRRRFAHTRVPGQESIECALATAEDVILSKLRWYRAGGESSQTQWNDLRGIVLASGATLNGEYLRNWAQRLGVVDLLERLLNEQAP